jgi:hypothetical protein
VLHQEALRVLASLDEVKFASMANSLESLAVASPTVEDLSDRMLAAVPSFDEPTAAALAEAVISIIGGREVHHDPTAAFVDGVATSTDLALDEASQRVLSDRLMRLIGLAPVMIVGKAADVAADQERIFHSARVFTDLRPVFGDDPSAGPLGAVVLHTLKVDYLRNGVVEDVYVVMDNEDLETLASVIDRARAKNTSIGRFLDETGFRRLVPHDSDGS